MEVERFKSISEQRLKRFAHIALAPIFVAQGIAELSPAVIELEIEERHAADKLVVRMPGYPPFQDYSAFPVFPDFGYEIEGSRAIGERRRAPIPHNLRVGNPTKTDPLCVDCG